MKKLILIAILMAAAGTVISQTQKFFFVSGTPTLNQYAQWVDDTTLKGVASVDTLATGAVDAIGEIASGLKSGADATLVTGTAGTNGDLPIWNVDGDIVDGPTPPSGAIVGTTDTQTLTNKTLTQPTINQDLEFTEQADHSCTPTAGTGCLWVKSDTPNVLVFTDDAGTDTTLGAAGTTNSVCPSGQGSLQISVEDPTASENITLTHAPTAVTIQSLRAVLVGSSTPSVSYDVVHGANRNVVGNETIGTDDVVTTVTTADVVTSFIDATVSADDWVVLKTSAQSGTVNEFHLTICYTET